MSSSLTPPPPTATAETTTTTATAAWERATQEGTLVCLEELEREYVAVKEQRDALQEHVQGLQQQLQTWQTQVTTLSQSQQETQQVQHELQTTRHQLQAAQEAQQLTQERLDRVSAQADALRLEIQRLTQQVTTLQTQQATHQATTQQAKLQTIPLLQQTERLQVSLQATQAQVSFFQSELQAQQRANQRLQADAHDKQVQLQLQVDQLLQEKDAAEASVDALRTIEEQLQDKVTSLTRTLQQVKQQAMDHQVATEQQYQQAERVTTMQQEQLQRWEQRYHDLQQQYQSVQRAAEQALLTVQQEREQERQEWQAKYDQQALLLSAAAASSLAAKQRAVQTTTTTTATTTTPLLPLPAPVGEAAPVPNDHPANQYDNNDDDDEDGEPMVGTVEWIQRLAHTKQALAQERAQHNQLKHWYHNLLLEIQQKAPLWMRQRREYDAAVEQLQDYQQRLEAALREVDEARAEARDARQDAQSSHRRVRAHQAEAQRLAQQVQRLLVQRAARGEEEEEHDTTSTSPSTTIGPNDIPTSVQQMQQHNQALLTEQHNLREQITQLEQQLASDMVRTKLQAAEAELQALRNERNKQARLVEQVVQQRDLYRALVAQQQKQPDQTSTTTSGDGDPDWSVVDLASHHAERARQLEEKNRTLEDQLATARGEWTVLQRQKDEWTETMARYEAHQTSLTEKVNVLERDLLTARSQVARAESDATYHQEKCLRLEESLTRVRDEVTKVTSLKQELQRINSGLQQALSKAQADTARLQSDVQQAERKARLMETQTLTAQAAERRLADENRQYRMEIDRQGTVIDSIRRIEASLSAQKETERDEWKQEVERLTAQLDKERERWMADADTSKARLVELEDRLQEAERRKDKAQSDAIQAKKGLLHLQTEKKQLQATLAQVEAKLKAAKRKLGEEDDDDAEAAEVALQAQIDRLQSELGQAREQIKLLNEQAADYEKVAQDSEAALVELRAATQTYKAGQGKELEQLKAVIQSMKQEAAAKQDVIQELTNDLAGQRGEREKVEATLKAEILSLQTEMANMVQDTESAKAAAAAMKLDVENLRKEAERTHNNYERELALHAEARTAVRLAREDADKEKNQRLAAEDQLDTLKQELEESRQVWNQEKAALQEATKLAEDRLKGARDQNAALHKQLETLGEMVEKNQAARVETAAGSTTTSDETGDLQKVIAELREVVKFLRSENEMVQAQMEHAKRTADRERAAANIVKRSLEEARAELQILQSRCQGTTNGTEEQLKETKAKLEASEDQINLLRDSNKLLREETEKLQGLLASANKEVEEAKASFEPAEKMKHDLELKIASLESERASLARDLEDWKNRVKSLVSKFNQVDPEEHKRLVQEVDTMKKEKESLNAWKRATEEENTRIRTIAKNLNQKNREQMTLIQTQRQEIERFAADKSKVPTKDPAITKEIEELKAKIAAMEQDAESKKKELDGNTVANERLRERLRQYMAEVKELKAKEQKVSEECAALKLQCTALKGQLAAQKKTTTTETTPTAVAASPALVPAATKKSVLSARTEAVPKPIKATQVAKLEPKLPTIPEGGFKFGPSHAKGEETPVEEATSVSVAKAPAPSLRVEAKPFTPAPASKPLSQESKPPAENPQADVKAEGKLSSPEIKIKSPEKPREAKPATRRLSGEKAEMSYKQRLYVKLLLCACIRIIVAVFFCLT